MSFEKLISELNGLESEQDNMLKALPAVGDEEDERIQAAAEDGGIDVTDEGQDLEREEDDEEEEVVAKSLGVVTLEDGNRVEAYDGTELVKSLIQQVSDLRKRHDDGENKVADALTKCVNVLKSQGELIKSLQEQVTRIGGEPRGRKSVLTVSEKKLPGDETLAKSESGLTPQDFLAKAHAAFDAGKISGVELTTIDVSLRMRQPVDTQLIQKVLS